jgi:Ca2+-binding EF-hand superfamily protein
MVRNVLLSILAALAMITCTVSNAAAGEHEGKRTREAEKDPELDTDKDGKLDHGELRAALDEEIGAIDADKDGKIDHGEQRKALQALRAKLDANKDGNVDDGEFRRAFADLKTSDPVLYHRLGERLHHRREKRERKK